jgi:enoyl-CoA hydratase/carnithine racemase
MIYRRWDLRGERLEYEGLLFEKRGKIAVVTLNRPQTLNALTVRMLWEELPDAWQRVKADPEIAVAILTAVGERAFCSGMDVKEAARTRAEGAPPAPGGRRTAFTARQNEVWKPVITAVNGLCGGGGLAFISDSDIVIASENASFFNPGVTTGQIAHLGLIAFTHGVPLQQILRMGLVGAHERMSAQRAYELGIVSEVVPPAALAEAAMALAQKLARNSTAAMMTMKRVLWEAMEVGWSEALRRSTPFMQAYSGSHPDFQEGPRAFAEKRPPRWDAAPPAWLEEK